MRTQSTYYDGSNFNPQNLNKVFKDKTGASEIYGSIFGENSRNPVSQDEYGEFIFINKGQSLSQIFGSPKNIDAVCKANGIKDKGKIQAGIKLYISSNGISQEPQTENLPSAKLPGNIEKHFLKENDNLKQIGFCRYDMPNKPGLSDNAKPVKEDEQQRILQSAGIDLKDIKNKNIKIFDDNGIKKIVQTINENGELYTKVFEVKTPQQLELNTSDNPHKDISEYGLKENNNLSVLYEDVYNPDSTPGLSGNVRAVSGNELSDILKTAGLNIKEYENKKGQNGVFLQKTIEGGAVQYLRAVEDDDGRKLIQTVKKDGEFFTKVFKVAAPENKETDPFFFRNWGWFSEKPQLTNPQI